MAFCVTASAVTKKEVQTLVEKHQYEEAIVALQTLMKQSAYANDGDCNKLLGQSLCMTGRYQEAVKPLEVAIRQNRRSGALWYQAIVRQHLYDFDGALEAIEAYRPVLKSEVWIERADSLEAECVQGQRAMNHVEDVEIIDSLVVSKSSFFSSYNLGPESGRVLQDDENGVFFENQAADYRIFANDGKLFESYKIRENWEDLHELKGVGSEEFDILMPFMRTDGETLYFACDSTPGMGGLDIYKTRFNSEDGEFYQPERLGMPFNSPFNDYMMAIDETHQVGWWATERLGDPENVIIFLFRLTDEIEFLEEPSVSRARIDCIAETWKQEGGYADVLASIMTSDIQSVQDESEKIFINDHRVYDSTHQFRNASAKSLYEQAQKMLKDIAEDEALLATLRKEYANASRGQKSVVAPQIRRIEAKLLSSYRQVHDMEKTYRKMESE